MSVVEQISSSQDILIILSISIMLFVGFAVTRITKLAKLPNVTAYIIAGILLGPFVLNVIPQNFVDKSGFLADIALAFISFGAGEFLKFSDLKKSGSKFIIITILESLLASILVFILTRFILKLESLSFCLVLSALASATAPASTLMTIRQTHAKGEFVNTLLQVVAADDIVALLAYSLAIAFAKQDASGGSFAFLEVFKSIGISLLIMMLGAIFGILLKLLMPKKRTNDNKLIIGVGMLFLFCGICTSLGQSPLLGCMSMGMIYINISGDDKFFKQLAYFSPPILLLFFVRSGINFDFNVLFSSSSIGSVSLVVVGITYFAVRILGKYAGAFLGGLVTKSPKSIKNYLGLALIPQAGVAIGLAALGAREIGGETGEALNTIILASSILYELIGPACAKASLYLSKSYSDNIEDLTDVEVADENGTTKNSVDILIDRISEIQKTLPAHEDVSEEELAFTEAASEYANNKYNHQPGLMFRRRK